MIARSTSPLNALFDLSAMASPISAIAIIASMTAIVTGCASGPPPRELLDARAAYDRATRGSAAQLAAADVENARLALALAEEAYADHPLDAEARDLAYVAERRAILAMSMGRAMEEERARVDAEDALEKTRSKQIGQAKSGLRDATRKTSVQATQLAAEQSARANAEMRARDAAQRLSRLATVKQEARGTVITLAGGLLFASGKSELLPDAKASLNEVAAVLKEQAQLSFTVIGHTDATGSDAANRGLSQRRADAVREYLQARGVDKSRVRSVGRGESEGIADNASAEGRAQNRRVEIVLSSHGFETDAGR